MISIIIAIRPEWVAKILNGKKTIEIRKTAPKCDLPIDVYIYCTKDGYLHLENNGHWSYSRNQKYSYIRHGKIVAKFTLKEVKEIHDSPEGTCDLNPNVPHPDWRHYYDMGLVSDKLLYGGDENSFSEEYGELLRKHSCLSQQQIFDYLNKDKNVIYGAKGYAWFISDLTIFDKPKELGEFVHPFPHCGNYCDNNFVPSFCKDYCSHNRDPERLDVWCDRFDKWGKPLDKAPRSWCYAEEPKR